MAEGELDVLVIGGGITGCGVALDAASRGLRTALVERDDFASGTSGRSSRLVHGGVRYLSHGEVGLVREALRERATILRLAPHLVRPLPIYAPAATLASQAALRAAFAVYDALAFGSTVAGSRSAGEEEVARRLPGLGRRSRAVLYHECPTDDARLTLEVARAAAAHGAHVANHAAAEALLGDGRVTGARVRDTLDGETADVRARVVVNATGVWSSLVQALAGQSRPQVASKGVHLVFRPGAIRASAGALIPSAANDGRRIFVIPWEDRYYAGTTDTAHEDGLDEPTVTEEDAQYVLDAVRGAFPDVNERCVVASWAGLRPLARGGNGATADLSRRHVVYDEPPGLLTVTGGKLTTYRAMAEDVVDRISRERCRTRELPLGLTLPLGQALAEARRAEAPPRLVERYGDDWREAAALIAETPSLGERVAPDAPVLGVERVLARTREMALTEEDVDVRRTRLASLGATEALPSTRG
jgi:glycerol-3-phosphate dehydrogenase